MKKFKSKIDIWFVLLLGIVLGGALLVTINGESWSSSIMMFLVIVFVSYIFMTTFYIIESQNLIIKSGFIVNMKIDIQNIKKISKSKNITSSPALSFDRLEILYNKFDTVLISPKDKSGFIEAILKINPQIEIKTKDN